MPKTAKDLARALGGELQGDASVEIRAVAALEDAGPFDLSFVDSPRRLEAAARSKAGILLVPPGAALPSRTTIAVADPRLGFARAVALLHPPRRPRPGVHATAAIDPGAALGKDVHVGAHAAIAASAEVGPRAVIGPGCVLGEGVKVGADCTLVARVVLYPGTVLGERVLVHAGAVLGSDGFGFVRSPAGRLEKFPQVGTLVIEDDVEIGANTTIDRGALGRTVIGRGTKIDNLVQVAHNVVVGEDCALSAQTGIAGSSRIEDRVTLAGQAGIADHARIEQDAIVGAQAGVPSHKVIRKGEVVWGTPARPLAEFKRQHAHLARIADLKERVRRLEERAGQDAPESAPEDVSGVSGDPD